MLDNEAPSLSDISYYSKQPEHRISHSVTPTKFETQQGTVFTCGDREWDIPSKCSVPVSARRM